MEIRISGNNLKRMQLIEKLAKELGLIVIVEASTDENKTNPNPLEK